MDDNNGKRSREIVEMILNKDPRVWDKLEEMLIDHPEWVEVAEHLVNEGSRPRERREPAELEKLPF